MPSKSNKSSHLLVIRLVKNVQTGEHVGAMHPSMISARVETMYDKTYWRASGVDATIFKVPRPNL